MAKVPPGIHTIPGWLDPTEAPERVSCTPSPVPSFNRSASGCCGTVPPYRHRRLEMGADDRVQQVLGLVEADHLGAWQHLAELPGVLLLHVDLLLPQAEP